MSDADNFYGDGTDFFDEFNELDENGNPVKKPADPTKEGKADELEEEAGEAGEYPSPKPVEKPVIDEKATLQAMYGTRSPELFKKKEKEEIPLAESEEASRTMYPNSPSMVGEPEDPLRNRAIVFHKISGSEILNQPGYESLKQALQVCGQCRQLDYARIEGEDLSGVRATDLSFKNASLVGVSFKSADIRNSDFSHAELECDFDRADLRGSNFSYADLSQCSFKDADLRNVDFRGATLPDSDAFKGATMQGIITQDDRKPSPQAEIFPT